MDRFRFHETETLARDLAGAVRVLNVDPLASDVLPDCTAPPMATPFPGMILHCDNRPCAAIGYSAESSGTVVISEPVVLLVAAEDICRMLLHRLLVRVKRRCAADGFRRLHFLQQELAGEDRCRWRPERQGFVHITDIIRWEWTVAPGNGRELTVKRNERNLPCSHDCRLMLSNFADSHVDFAHDLRIALDEILETSQDLASQPHPTGAELVTQWQKIQAQIFVCYIGQRIAGVMSCAMNTTVSPTATSAVHPPDTNCCIEYIGVVPEFRQRQVATEMIRQIPTLINRVPDHNDNGIGLRGLKVTAYSDAENAPATYLYQGCGFVPADRMHLWSCDLEKTDGH